MKSQEARILHVLRSESWGGLESYTLEFICNLNKSGVKSSLFCKRGSKVELEAIARGITTITDSLWRVSRDEIYTHIHVHRRQDLPVIRFALLGKSTPLFYSLYMAAPPKRDLYHAWIYKRLSGMASSSELLNQEVIQNFPIEKSKVHLVRYGREWHIRSDVTDIKPNGKMIFGTMCRLDSGKGVSELAHSLTYLDKPTLSQMELWIIGDPTLERLNSDGTPVYEQSSLKLKSDLTEFAERDELMGSLKLIPYQKDLAKYLSALDVFILNSVRETYSLAVIDAMLMGIPVIGSHAGGTIEQIGENESRGLFTEVGNSKSIAQALQKLISSKKLILEKGMSASEWSHEQHSWQKCIASWKSIYRLS